MSELVKWLRRCIEQRRYLAQHAIELGSAAEWTELSSGVLMTCAPDARQDTWDGVWAMGDSSLTRLMEANDPRDTLARCEVELAILDAHHILTYAETFGEKWEDWSVWRQSDSDVDFGCVTCHYFAQGTVRGYGYCRTVRLVAWGYRFREGYAEVAGDWAP